MSEQARKSAKASAAVPPKAVPETPAPTTAKAPAVPPPPPPANPAQVQLSWGAQSTTPSGGSSVPVALKAGDAASPVPAKTSQPSVVPPAAATARPPAPATATTVQPSVAPALIVTVEPPLALAAPKSVPSSTTHAVLPKTVQPSSATPLKLVVTAKKVQPQAAMKTAQVQSAPPKISAAQPVIDLAKDDDDDDDDDAGSAARPPSDWGKSWRKSKKNDNDEPANQKKRGKEAANDDDDDDDNDALGSGSGSSKKIRGAEQSQTFDVAKDKWIVCRECHNKIKVLPGFLGSLKIPAYDKLQFGPNKRVCDACTRACRRCGLVKEAAYLAGCDDATCNQYVCLKCADRKKQPLGPFWCSSVCRDRNEKPIVTGSVLWFCSENINPRGASECWAVCRTCVMTVCPACATACHIGHDVLPAVRGEKGRWCHGIETCRCGQLKCCRPPAHHPAAKAIRSPDANDKDDSDDVDNEKMTKLGELALREAELHREIGKFEDAMRREAKMQQRLEEDKRLTEEKRTQISQRLRVHQERLVDVGKQFTASRQAVDAASARGVSSQEETALREKSAQWAATETRILAEREAIQKENGPLATRIVDIDRNILARESARKELEREIAPRKVELHRVMDEISKMFGTLKSGKPVPVTGK